MARAPPPPPCPTCPAVPPPLCAKHDIKSFLAQPTVHSFMRSSWTGGGFNELLQSPPEEIYKVVATWFFLWWVILPYNLLVLLASAFLPPFEEWYTKRLGFHHRETHERILYGMFFIPCVKYGLQTAADVLIAVQFTTQSLMPFNGGGERCQRSTGIRAECPVFGGDADWDFSLVVLYIQVRERCTFW